MTIKRIGRREAIALIGAAGAALTAGAAIRPRVPHRTRPVQRRHPQQRAARTPPASSRLPRRRGRSPRSRIWFAVTSARIGTGRHCPSPSEWWTPAATARRFQTQPSKSGSATRTAATRSPGSERAETYLRGVQTTNAAGEVTFTTVYPGWYQGRATHIHVEVSIGGRSVKVTRIAFDEAVNATVYASGVYAARRIQPDVQSVGRHLRRQPVLGARHTDREPVGGVRGNVPGRRVALGEARGPVEGQSIRSLM